MREIIFKMITLFILVITGSANAQDSQIINQGKKVYDHYCSWCHSGGERLKFGTKSLQMKYNGAIPAALEDRTDMNHEYIERFVRKGIGLMVKYRKTEINDADFDALVAYLTRNNK